MNHPVEIWWQAIGEYGAQPVIDVPPECELRKISFSRLGINEVEQLIQAAYRRPTTGYETLLLVVFATKLPTVAQQRLLKLLEEPPETTYFRFYFPTTITLLPTVRSRVWEQVSAPAGETAVNKQFADFIATDIPNRLLQIDRAHKKQDKEWFIQLFSAAQAVTTSDARVVVEGLPLVLEYAQYDGASPKLLAEQLAFLWPN